jgi:hypothetical protein
MITLRGHKNYVNQVAFSLTGGRLASASEECTLSLRAG